MTVKEKLHLLIDELPERELSEIQSYLEQIYSRYHDPVFQSLMNAPEDDEPESEEEKTAVDLARLQLADGEVVAWEKVRSNFFSNK